MRKAWPLRWSPSKSFGVAGFSLRDGSWRAGAAGVATVGAGGAGVYPVPVELWGFVILAAVIECG